MTLIGGQQPTQVGMLGRLLMVPHEPDDVCRHAGAFQQVCASVGVPQQQV